MALSSHGNKITMNRLKYIHGKCANYFKVRQNLKNSELSVLYLAITMLLGILEDYWFTAGLTVVLL